MNGRAMIMDHIRDTRPHATGVVVVVCCKMKVRKEPWKTGVVMSGIDHGWMVISISAGDTGA